MRGETRATWEECVDDARGAHSTGDEDNETAIAAALSARTDQ